MTLKYCRLTTIIFFKAIKKGAASLDMCLNLENEISSTMKIKITLLLLIPLIISPLFSQDISTDSVSIKWNGIEVWTSPINTKEMISFYGATYPQGGLPYFSKRISCKKTEQFKVHLSDIAYQTITDSNEIKLIKDENIPSEIAINTFYQTARENNYFNVEILPFIKKNGEILKVKNFNLIIENTTNKRQKSLAASANTIHTYTSSSVLANGKFIKIKVNKSGIYKLTYETLKSMGIDPANVRIFGYGGAMLQEKLNTYKPDDLPEIAIYMNKGSDGVFNAGDYILFYAQGVTSWTYNPAYKSFTHTINPYSTAGYYFVTSDAGTGKKIENTAYTLPENKVSQEVTQFTDYQVHEEETANLINSGKVFYGEKFSDRLTYNFSFDFPNIIKTVSASAKLSAMAKSLSTTQYSLSLDGTQQQTMYVNGNSKNEIYGYNSTSYFYFAPTTNSINSLSFDVTYKKSLNSDIGYLDYLEVNCKRELSMAGDVMFFRNIDNLNSGNYNHFILSNATSATQIWDITDPSNIKQVNTTLTAGAIDFYDTTDSLKQYVAINPASSGSFSEPTVGETVANQNLHANEPSDFIIITYPEFLSQAQKLATAHEQKDNMKVNVVTTEQVYNEFSSGTPDATAYRWYAKMLYDRALTSSNTTHIPKYLLLLGRGSFDNRGLLTTSGKSFVLTYQANESLNKIASYVTDDYFGLLDDNEGANLNSDLLDLGVGRFTVVNSQEATDVVNKTINYIQNANRGMWKNQLCFLGDDGDDGGTQFMTQADSITRMLQNINKSYQYNKIYLDAYKQEENASGESYPLARTKVINLINSGVFFFNFVGHAGSTGITNEQILKTADIEDLYNTNLGFWVAATCDFVIMDEKEISAGEWVLLNPSGGGIGILSAARTVYATNNFMLNRPFDAYLFSKDNEGKHRRLGDAVRLAKNSLVSSGDQNKLSYVLLGDPALRLNYPDDYSVITDSINGKVTSSNDTIKALSIETIAGHIEDANGNINNDFNGILEINIYDKSISITTLNNEGNGTITYNDRPNIIYSGKTKVENGKFSFIFMTPKDIKYNYGTGRINYYASDSTNSWEAQGNDESFIIGGASTNFNSTDTIGPDINLYLNYDGFKSGDKVNETPLFIATLNDENGINTVGNGIGHDLRLTIDENSENSYILNNDFKAATNSYTSGTVEYKLPALKDGKHTLNFKAWDLLNNSSTATLDFEVVTGLNPQLINITCYPNPAKTSTQFKILHDRPESAMEAILNVYDLTGRIIWSKTQNSANDISWDLTDYSGNKVQKGIYLYKVSIKTDNSSYTSKANKIIITSLY